MEQGVFLQPSVSLLLDRYFVEARLHLDGDVNLDRIRALQDKYAGHQGLPVYVVIDPDSQEVLGKFEQATFDPDEFASFLRDAAGP